MAQLPYRLRTAALVIIGIIALAFTMIPEQSLFVARNLVAVWDALLLAGSVAVLLWFVYRVFLRKLWRARRIANIRLRRLLDERAPRE